MPKVNPIDQAYRDLFNSDLGNKVLADLHDELFWGRTCFVPGDPHSTSFNEGKREALGYILSRLSRTSPTLLAQLDELIAQRQLKDQDYE